MPFTAANEIKDPNMMRVYPVAFERNITTVPGRYDTQFMWSVMSIFCQENHSLYFVNGNEIHKAIGTNYPTDPKTWETLKNTKGKRNAGPILGQVQVCEDGFFIYCSDKVKTKFYGKLWFGSEFPVAGTYIRGSITYETKQVFRQTNYIPSKLQNTVFLQANGAPP